MTVAVAGDWDHSPPGRVHSLSSGEILPSVCSLDYMPELPTASMSKTPQREEGRGKEERIQCVQPQTSQGDLLSSPHGSQATIGFHDPSGLTFHIAPAFSRGLGCVGSPFVGSPNLYC